jgi:hypothetical protein
MKHLVVFLATACIVCVQGVSVCAQAHSLSSAYHRGDHTSYLGATLSSNLITANRDRVMIRGVLSYLTGTIKRGGESARPADRMEAGLESKNKIYSDHSLFNVMDLEYVWTRSDNLEGASASRVRDRGFMFAIGLGARIADPVSVLGKYVTGPDHGVRFVMEVDF